MLAMYQNAYETIVLLNWYNNTIPFFKIRTRICMILLPTVSQCLCKLLNAFSCVQRIITICASKKYLFMALRMRGM